MVHEPIAAQPSVDAREEPLFSEAEWEALRTGKDHAREVLYRRYAGPLHRAIRGWAHGLTAEESEDLLAESFVRAFRNLARVQALERLEGWLFAVARNAVMDFCRARGRATKVLLLDDLSPDGRARILAAAQDAAGGDVLAALSREEDRARLSALVGQVLAELPARQQEALILKYKEGFDLAALSAHLQIAPEAAAALLYRAREAFRARFARRAEKGP